MLNQGTPIYLITGFLDAGKTDFITFTMQQPYFDSGERTVLIVCEEGEKEYDPVLLADHNTVQVMCESEADFTTDFLKNIKRKYRPERVLIEYNGMWRLPTIMDMKLPFNWDIYQVINIVNGETFGLYLNNMKSLVMEQVQTAEMVMFNRCTEDMPCASYRRAIRATNRRVQVIFEDAKGEMLDIPEELPYSLDTPEIHIEDDDYGIWYMDAMDHPENYENKTICFKAMAMNSNQFPKGYFVPGRQAMTCCANDIRFLGYLCKPKDSSVTWKNKSWVNVKATFENKHMDLYEGEGPVLTAVELTPAEARTGILQLTNGHPETSEPPNL